ncbi:MAG: hypothetical protein MH252_07605 [Thermosynechococcaceae cyanobacterium MS004]|nr:hypothetical protein [Thermosynechococcaceae cyanobacterium MS004]
MLKIVATLPDRKYYQQIANRGERWQWQDVASDRLRVIAPANYDPWQAENPILIRLENGKTRENVSFPRRLNLLVLPPGDAEGEPAQIIREQWFGGFAHSTCPTEAFFAFPALGKGESWLMISILVNKDT